MSTHVVGYAQDVPDRWEGGGGRNLQNFAILYPIWCIMRYGGGEVGGGHRPITRTVGSFMWGVYRLWTVRLGLATAMLGVGIDRLARNLFPFSGYWVSCCEIIRVILRFYAKIWKNLENHYLSR